MQLLQRIRRISRRYYEGCAFEAKVAYAVAQDEGRQTAAELRWAAAEARKRNLWNSSVLLAHWRAAQVERLLRDAGARRLADWLKRAAQKHLTQEAVSLPPRKVVRMARALERQR